MNLANAYNPRTLGQPFSLFTVLAMVLLLTAGGPARAQDNESAEPISTTPISTTQSAQFEEFSPRFSQSQLRWRMGLIGASFSDASVERRVGQFETHAKYKVQLLQPLEFRVHPFVSLQGGHEQARYDSDLPASGVYLNEALLDLKPVPVLSLAAGIVSQEHLRSPLLVSARGFPGAIETLTLGDPTLSVEIKAQQTVPTSRTLSTQTTEREKAPAFLSETLTLKAKPTRALRAELYGTHYRFQNLTTVAAGDSELYGNSVEAPGPNATRFRYEFDGWLAGASGEVRWSPRFQTEAGLQVIENTKAPAAYNHAQTVYGKVDVRLRPQVWMTSRYETFFNESDTAPAVYSSDLYGNNNRVGYRADLDFAFKKAGFKVGGRFVETRPINASLHQTRQQLMLLRFETLYEIL